MRLVVVREAGRSAEVYGTFRSVRQAEGWAREYFGEVRATNGNRSGQWYVVPLARIDLLGGLRDEP